MKRFLCIIIAVGIGMLSYAANQNDKTLKEYKELSEKMSTYSKQINEINDLLNKFMKNGEKMQKIIDDLQKEKEQLDNEKKAAEKTISCRQNCKMLIEYPLMVKYDSALVAHSLNTIKTYKLADQAENKVFCKMWVPVLTDYGKYYMSVLKMIQQIQAMYVKFNQPYTIELYNKDLEKTDYYKNCYNKGYNIKFLDAQIKAVELLINENRLTSGNITEIIDNMK